MKRPEINKLDKLWGSIVKATRGYVCEMCGVRGRMEAAHVVGRRHRTTRWGCWRERTVGLAEVLEMYYDLCGHCLCHVCHQQYDEHGPLEDLILENVIGIERKKNLQFLAKNSVTKYQDYEEIKAHLTTLLPTDS